MYQLRKILFPICGEKDIIPYMHTWAHILLPPFSYTKIRILKEEITQENGKKQSLLHTMEWVLRICMVIPMG